MRFPPSESWRKKDKGWRENTEKYTAHLLDAATRYLSCWVINSGQRVYKIHFHCRISLLETVLGGRHTEPMRVLDLDRTESQRTRRPDLVPLPFIPPRRIVGSGRSTPTL
jgi:hypothetical protein